MKAKFFFRAPLCAAFGSGQFLCPGNFSILAMSLNVVIRGHWKKQVVQLIDENLVYYIT